MNGRVDPIFAEVTIVTSGASTRMRFYANTTSRMLLQAVVEHHGLNAANYALLIEEGPKSRPLRGDELVAEVLRENPGGRLIVSPNVAVGG